MTKTEHKRKKRETGKKRQYLRKKRSADRNQISDRIIKEIETELTQSNFFDVWKRVNGQIKGKKLRTTFGKKFTSLLNYKKIHYKKHVFVFTENKNSKKIKELKVNETKMSSTGAYDSNQKFKSLVYNRPKN